MVIIISYIKDFFIFFFLQEMIILYHLISYGHTCIKVVLISILVSIF